jgi:predicted RND superfamily exporter protein
MERIAHLLVRHRRRVLVATALLSLLALAMLTRIAFNADVTSFLTEGNERGQAFAALQQKYDAGDPITILIEREDGGVMTDREGLLLLFDTREALAAVEGVASIGSLIPDSNPLTGDPITRENLERLPVPVLALLTAGPGSELLLSVDRQATFMAVLPEGDGIALASQLQRTELPEGAEVTFAGNPVVFASVISLLGWFLLAIPPLVIVLLMAIFVATVGAPRLAAMAIVPAVLGSLWTFGLIFGLGLRVDIVTVVVPIFVIVMGSANGLHIVTHLQQAAARTSDRAAQMALTLREVGVPIILTSVSTAAGFLSLLAVDVRPVRQLGLFVAVGIVFAGIIALTTLPAILSGFKITPRVRGPRFGRSLVDGVRWAASRRWTAWALVLPLVAFAAIFLPRLAVNPDQLFFFKDNHPVRAQFARVTEAFGGATPLFGEFALDRSQPLDEQLERLRAVTQELEGLPGVRRVFSVADIVQRVPAAQRDALLSGEITPPLGPMVSDDGLRFAFFTEAFTTEDLQGWTAYADASPEVRVLTGTPLLFDEMGRVVLRAQLTSLIAAFVLVGLMLLIAYRRLGQTLVALLPLLLTTAVVLAFIAASGIQLNILTAIITGIVIGVGIDYAIHLFAAIEHARPSGPGYVHRALDVAGRPIIANALGVALGMSALLISPLKPHSQISAILWVAMVVSALAALLIIPAFMSRDGVQAGGTAPDDAQTLASE